MRSGHGLGVEVRQRLVHEEDLRGADDRAAHGHPLALTTGESLRLALEIRLEVEDLGSFLDALADLGLLDAGDLQGEAHVVGDRHVRIERVVLEDHRHVAVLGREVGDVPVTDPDLALVDLFETGEHAQGGGLATAGGADDDEELTVFDVDVELVDGRVVVARVDPGRPVELHCCHGVIASFLCRQVRAGRSVAKDCNRRHGGESGFASMPRPGWLWKVIVAYPRRALIHGNTQKIATDPLRVAMHHIGEVSGWGMRRAPPRTCHLLAPAHPLVTSGRALPSSREGDESLLQDSARFAERAFLSCAEP